MLLAQHTVAAEGRACWQKLALVWMWFDVVLISKALSRLG